MRFTFPFILLALALPGFAQEKPPQPAPAPQVAIEIVHFWSNECATCHGQQGEGIEEARAPAIAGLPDYYVLEQVTKYRQNLRQPGNESGFVAEMHREAVELDDPLFKQLAMHIASLPVKRPKRTVAGDPEAGSQPYQELCAGCHGNAAQGDLAKRIPPLHAFQDWYIVEQIRRFRVGLRKPDPAQGESLQMHAMAMRFPSLDEAREIALYINSHLPGEPDAEP